MTALASPGTRKGHEKGGTAVWFPSVCRVKNKFCYTGVTFYHWKSSAENTIMFKHEDEKVHVGKENVS